MRKEKHITAETMDLLVEWIFCHWPCALEQKKFVRGIFFICDEAITEAVKNRQVLIFDRLRMHSPN